MQILAAGVPHELTVGYTQNRREAYSGDSAPTVNVPQNLNNPVAIAPINPAAFRPGTDSPANCPRWYRSAPSPG